MIWTAVIFVACFIPGNDVPKVKIFQIDKLVHFALFGGCSFLWAAGLHHNGKKTISLWVVSACIVLGILVELIQSSSWVTGRTGDGWDVMADTIGAFLGIWLYHVVKSIVEKGNRD